MHARIQRNAQILKYVFLIVCILTSISAVKTYLNFLSIETETAKVKLSVEKKQEEIAYIQNFLLPYLQSEYAQYFLSHENNRLYKDEFIVKFAKPETLPSYTGENTAQTGLRNILSSPQQARKHFFAEKFAQIK